MKINCSVSKPKVFTSPTGYIVAVTVEYAAVELSVSTRRIRKMLADGKLKGTKVGQSWRIDHPYQMTIGTRGPLNTYTRYKLIGVKRSKADLKALRLWNKNKHANIKLKKGV